MSESSNGLITQLVESIRDFLERVFEPRTVKLLLLAAVALGLAVLNPGRVVHSSLRVAGVSLGGVVTWSFIVLGAVLTLAAIASGLVELFAQRTKGSRLAVLPQSLPLVLGADLVISLDVGRHYISYGAVQFQTVRPNREAYFLKDLQMTEIVPTKTRTIRPGVSRRQLYDEMIFTVMDVLDSLQRKSANLRVSGLSVTTPSWTDIRSKSLASTIGPFPVNETIGENLARYLWNQDQERISRAFGSRSHKVENRQDLMECIYLDTDSRSAARYDLHQRLRSGLSWENYACVIILEGIGAGLILNQEIYYGSHASEGEVGHTTVHMGPEYRLVSIPGSSVTIDRCACQLPGIHWESIAGTTGPSILAEAVSKESFLRLETGFGHLPSGRDLLNAACLARDVDCPDELPAPVRELIIADRPHYRAYLGNVFREYSRIVTIGIANMANILDLDHVVIGGPLIKDLDRLGFRNEIRSYWNDYVLRGQTVGHSYKSLRQIWQGAALLFWDPAYYRQIKRLPGAGMLDPVVVQ